MDLFATLEKKQKKTLFERSDEMGYFLDHSAVLLDYPTFSSLRKAQSSFQIERANIVLRSLFAKEAIEKGVKEAKTKSNGLDGPQSQAIYEETLKPILAKLPYHLYDGEKIYIPFFSRSLNRIYVSEWGKLISSPYKRFLKNFDSIIIDPFDYYGDDLYESLFTKLVRVKKTDEGSAFYDYDAFAIYFVNKQGRLDCKCCLFDRYLKEQNRNHMMERVAPVVDAYYKGDCESFKRLLVENKLISSRLIYKINYDEVVTFSKIEKDCALK